MFSDTTAALKEEPHYQLHACPELPGEFDHLSYNQRMKLEPIDELVEMPETICAGLKYEVDDEPYPMLNDSANWNCPVQKTDQGCHADEGCDGSAGNATHERHQCDDWYP
jgi:hypothetical protein